MRGVVCHEKWQHPSQCFKWCYGKVLRYGVIFHKMDLSVQDGDLSKTMFQVVAALNLPTLAIAFSA